MDKTQLSNLQKISTHLKILSADMVEKAQSGHPGMPLGFADVFSTLIQNHLNFSNQNPEWYNRDRLVLSAGHGSALLYSFLHFAEFEGYGIDQIKNFRQINSNTPGHPEFDKKLGIETTTGPLGQGFATSVGMAIAQKKYNTKLGDIINHNIYTIVGDGCLMEGISYEAASLAGHLKLNNLIVLFDSNKISIDGSTSLTTSENHIEKFKSFGWDVFSCDGHDFKQIDKIIHEAKKSDKPAFIEFTTNIGKGAGDKENSEKSHGAPLGDKHIQQLRENLNWDKEPFEFDESDYSIWKQITDKNNEQYENWLDEFSKLDKNSKEYLEPVNTDKILEQISMFSLNNYKDEATRVSSGKLLELIQKNTNKIIAGSADLSGSNGVINQFSKPITKDDFSGNYIHFGVRENAMAAIMNGIQIENFKAFCATFLVFSDYMRPSIRLSALMNLPVTYVLTHDSIGLGEDGPTHQPIEHLSSLRAIPNLKIYRPADIVEISTSFTKIFRDNDSPSILALSRQKIEQFAYSVTRAENATKGAYIFDIDENEQIDVSIWATGSELQITEKVKELLNKASLSVAIISAPCLEDFYMQNHDYQNDLLNLSSLNVAIEAGARMSWDRIIGRDGLFFGMENFGASGKAEELYKYFNITAGNIANRIIERLDD